MYKVAIVGASGYTGGELLRILLSHQKVEVAAATSRQFEGNPVHKVHPHLKGLTDLSFSSSLKSDYDIIFTATPHGTSMNVVPDLIEEGLRVIDLSGDFRFEDFSLYEKYYGIEHRAKNLRGIYGLPELYRDKIRDANLVANPGCFPIGAILGILPLVKNRLIEERIIIDSKTGTSGAGAAPSKRTHHPECGEDVIPYNITHHRHMPEIEKELRKFGSAKVHFTPHLVPIVRGILTTIHAFPKKDFEPEEIREVYIKFYSGEKFVRILECGEVPKLSAVRGSNYIDIGGFSIDKNDRLVIFTSIDNLVKGGSGNAVQNMNVMLNIEEDTGLHSIGLHP
ncbi:MAG: N-acetyl-gamma-glutamyl-phosphate reductase [Candidatus Hydrothermarchaeota archaeon]